jgi:hypothetical protein
MEIQFDLTPEMLADAKAEVLDKIEQGFDVADVPCDLLAALIERAYAWEYLQVVRLCRPKQKEGSHEPTDVG